MTARGVRLNPRLRRMDLEEEEAAALIAEAAQDAGSLGGSDEEASDGDEDEDFMEQNAKVRLTAALGRGPAHRRACAAPPRLPRLPRQVAGPAKTETEAKGR